MPGMTPFRPLDGDILWSVSQGVEATRGFVGVFGTYSPYEAYLFVLAVKESCGSHLTLKLLQNDWTSRITAGVRRLLPVDLCQSG